MAYTIIYETNADLPTGVSVNINLTRGDYLPLTIEMEKEDEAFTPNTGSLRFALKKKYKNSDTELLLNKAIPLDTRLLELEGDDTKPLAFGDYDYDIQYTDVSGHPCTFIIGKLTLSQEVY